MNRPRLHPSDKDLLLFADGELGKRQAAAIERHLASCWPCRALLAETENAINDFVTLRRKLLSRRLEDSAFPSGRTSRAMLGARLAQVQQSDSARGRRNLWRALRLPALSWRPLWTAGSLVALVLVLLLIEPLLAPAVSAMDVIDNGRAAEDRRPPIDAVRHQRVRIHSRKQNAPPAIVDCDLWKNASRSRMLIASGRSDPADRLRALYRTLGADWEHPLSVKSFATLRNSLGAVRDEVRGRDPITLTSIPERRGDVKRLELTVRRSDWHAISQRIELNDADFVLTELLDETVARDKIDASVFAPPPPTSPTTIAALRPPHRTLLPPPPTGPGREQLDSAEIQLREAFHRTWADVEEVPEIRREGEKIRVRLFTQSAERRQEIETALNGIPYLAPEITDPQTIAVAPPPTGPTPVPQPTLYATEPPLAKALRDYSGGLDPANSYLNAVQDDYLQVLVEASALTRLAERYSDPEWSRLSPESQQRLNRIAADHIAAVRTNVRNYLKLVTPVLEEMLTREHLSLPAKSEAADGNCATWRAAAHPFVADLSSMQASFRRLFVEERTEHPVTLSVTELLGQAVQSRLQLQHHQLCQP